MDARDHNQGRSDRAAAVAALNARYVACPACDELWGRPALAEGEKAVCTVCHATVLHRKSRSAERTVALMLASLILYAVAVSFPFMSLERSGLSNQISVIDAVLVLASNNMVILALMCGGLILAFPLIRMVLLLWVGGVLHADGIAGRRHLWSFRVAQALEPWTMAEIFMIGVIVSLVKVGKLANIAVGPAFWAMSGLIVLLAMGSSAVCRDSVWHRFRGVS